MSVEIKLEPDGVFILSKAIIDLINNGTLRSRIIKFLHSINGLYSIIE